jgi:hypothetical protein
MNGAWPAGAYQVFVKTTWVTNDVKDFSLRAYFPTAVEFVKITEYSSAIEA